MKSKSTEQMILQEITTLAGSFCGDEEISRSIAVVTKGTQKERRFLHEERAETSAPRIPARPSFDQMLEQIVTFCSQKLGPYDYQNLLLSVGDIFVGYGKLTDAERFYDLVVEYGIRNDHTDFIAEGLFRRGKVYARQGMWRKSQTDFSESRSLFNRVHNDVAIARVDNAMGANFAEQGDITKAREALVNALRRFEMTQLGLETGMVLMNLGIIQNILGAHSEALDYYLRVVPYFQKAGDLNRLAELRHNIAMTYRSLGKNDAALHEYDESLSYSRKTGNPALMGIALLGKADLYRASKDYPLALVFANQAQEQFTVVGDRGGIAEVYKVKGAIFREQGEYEIAHSQLQVSLRINDEIRSVQNTAETHFEMGLLEKSRNNAPAATEHFQKALSGFQKMGARTEVEAAARELHDLGGS